MSDITLGLDKIFVDHEFNCRGKFGEDDIKDLAKSIALEGLLQSVVVFELPTPYEGRTHKLVAGFRRYMAHIFLQKEDIRCNVRPPMGATDAIVANLIENVQRKDLTMYREALAVRPLFDMGLKEPAIMQRLSVSRGWIQVRHYILLMPDWVQAEFIATEIWGIKEIREAYTTLNKDGESGLRAMVKLWKEARKAGRGSSLKQTTTIAEIKKKKSRSKVDMENMQGIIMTQLGPCFATRLLAWASGFISDFELYQDIKVECDKAGKTFIVPEISL